MKDHLLIKSGFLVPVVFWGTTIICGFFMPGYDHTTRMVSELGEVGTKTQYLFSIGFVLTSVFSAFFNIGLYKSCKKNGLNILPVLILWTFSFSIMGAGIVSYPQRLHGILGSPSIILFLSPLTALLFWKNKTGSAIKVLSFFSFVIMALGFLVFANSVLSEYIGIKQRIFHLGWTVWVLSLASVFSLKRNRNTQALPKND